jgi:hypothetical protein
MDTDFTHAYCDNCGTIKPAIRKSLEAVDDEENFAGGDVLCGECRFIIASVYKKIEDNSVPPGQIKQTPDE